jgi:hypothetical protein
MAALKCRRFRRHRVEQCRFAQLLSLASDKIFLVEPATKVSAPYNVGV